MKIDTTCERHKTQLDSISSTLVNLSKSNGSHETSIESQEGRLGQLENGIKTVSRLVEDKQEEFDIQLVHVYNELGELQGVVSSLNGSQLNVERSPSQSLHLESSLTGRIRVSFIAGWSRFVIFIAEWSRSFSQNHIVLYSSMWPYDCVVTLYRSLISQITISSPRFTSFIGTLCHMITTFAKEATFHALSTKGFNLVLAAFIIIIFGCVVGCYY